LRAQCALALADAEHPDALDEIGDLLADPEAEARHAAANALARLGDPAALGLLRLRILMGDEDPAVVSECVRALLALGGEAASPFVARLLDTADPAVQEAAALALGEARAEGALELLRGWWEGISDHRVAAAALLAIAMIRSREAHVYLASLVAEADRRTAEDAVRALAICRHDRDLAELVHRAAEKNGDPSVLTAFRRCFEAGDEIQ
jgi:HEAT repeat protein